MGMVVVVVLEPSGELPERRDGVRQCIDANIVALEGFDEALGHAVGLRALDGVKQGTRLSATAKSRVSLAA